jgi:hypothetical protein
MAAPTKVSYTETGNTQAVPTTGVTTAAIAVQAGDLVVVWGGDEDATTTGAITLSLLGGLTGALTGAQSDATTSYAPVAIGTAPVTASGNLQGKAVATGSGSHAMNCGVCIYRNHGGVGVSGKSHQAGGTTPSLALSLSANSALFCALTDWSAVGGARTYLQINGANPTEGGHFSDSGVSWHYDAFDYADVGAAGSKTAGESAPTAQTPNLVAVEILASTVPAPIMQYYSLASMRPSSRSY